VFLSLLTQTQCGLAESGSTRKVYFVILPKFFTLKSRASCKSKKYAVARNTHDSISNSFDHRRLQRNRKGISPTLRKRRLHRLVYIPFFRQYCAGTCGVIGSKSTPHLMHLFRSWKKKIPNTIRSSKQFSSMTPSFSAAYNKNNGDRFDEKVCS
jgi:hypothetical protein